MRSELVLCDTLSDELCVTMSGYFVTTKFSESSRTRSLRRSSSGALPWTARLDTARSLTYPAASSRGVISDIAHDAANQQLRRQRFSLNLKTPKRLQGARSPARGCMAPSSL